MMDEQNRFFREMKKFLFFKNQHKKHKIQNLLNTILKMIVLWTEQNFPKNNLNKTIIFLLNKQTFGAKLKKIIYYWMIAF